MAISPADTPLDHLTTVAPAPVYQRRRSLLILAMIVTFMVVNFADKSVLGLAAVPIMHDLHMSKTTYGLTASSFSLLFSLTGLIGGFVSTRMSSRMLLFGMAALWAVAQVPVLLVAAVPALIVSRVCWARQRGRRRRSRCTLSTPGSRPTSAACPLPCRSAVPRSARSSPPRSSPG